MNIFDDNFTEGSNADELSPGTELMLGQYQITRYLNSGGFGITYLAKDSLDRSVVIKECYPRSFCRRSNMLVQARSQDNNGELRSIVRLFTHEARSLSKLKHPFIVGVHQVFEDNNTAYMALDFVEGHDLLAVIEQKVLLLRPDQITAILQKTLDAIKCVHSGGLLHRDIAPDNIILTNELNPVLIDFGAAREQATKATRALSALRVVKDGYSPQEFYIAGSEQGPYSDLYSLAASFYHLITGELPPDSQVRLSAHVNGTPDPYIPLDLKTSDYSDAFCSAINKAMAILPKDRMQSADEWLVHLAQPQKSARRVSRIKSKSKSKQRPVSVKAPVQAAKKPMFSARFGAVIVGGTIAASMVVAYPYLRSSLIGEQPVATTQALSSDTVSPSSDDADLNAGPGQDDVILEASEATDAVVVEREEATSDPSAAQTELAETEMTPEEAIFDAPAQVDVIAAAESDVPAGKDTSAVVTAAVPAAQVTFDSAPQQASYANVTVLKDFVTSYADGKVAAEWSVGVPFDVDASARIFAVSKDAPDWLKVGALVTEVNGTAVSNSDEVQTALRDAALTGDGEYAFITLLAQNPGEAAPVAGEFDAKIIYSALVSDRYKFSTQRDGAEWLTTVVEVPSTTAVAGDAPELRPGDVLVALLDSDEEIRDGASVARIVASKITAGNSRLQFAVNRDGLMWIVDVETDA